MAAFRRPSEVVCPALAAGPHWPWGALVEGGSGRGIALTSGAAAQKGYRVKCTLATRLVNELVEAADEKVLAKTIDRYGRADPIT